MKKGSLLSKKALIEDRRNSLYFDQFSYVALFFLKEASALRSLEPENIDQTVEFRNNWRFRVTEDDRRRLHDTADYLRSLTNPFKTTISYNWIYFYTNELCDIDLLATQSPMTKNGPTRQAVVTHSKDVVALRHPQHLFRTYIKSHKPDSAQLESLANFLHNNRQEIRLSPGLRDFLAAKNRHWLSDSYFVDHNDMRMVTALALLNPRLVRKTLPIVQLNN